MRTLVLAAVMFMAAGLGAVVAAAAEPYTLPLTVSVNPGCRIEKGVVTLFDQLVSQEGREPVILECENAVSLFFQADVFSRKAGDDLLQIKQSADQYQPQADDPQASGGRYVDYCHEARYPFRLSTAGEYQIWVRHWVPVVGSWNYEMQVDACAIAAIELAPVIPAAKSWFWVKGPACHLARGTHVLRVTHLHNGKRMDQILLTPDKDYVPKGVAGPATPLARVDESELRFAEVVPVGLKRWDRLAYERLDDAGQVAAEVSFDQGQTWQRPGADGSLADLQAADRDRLTVRLKLVRDAKGSPALRNVAVVYAYDPDRLIVLDNGKLQFLFAKANGALTGVRNLQTGTIYSPLGVMGEMFELLVKAPGKPEQEWLSATSANLLAARRSADSASFEWGLKGDTIKVRFDIRLDASELSHWDVTVTNGSPTLDVMELVAPKIPQLRISKAAEDDVLAWPFTAGEIHSSPASRGELHCEYPDHAGFPFADLYGAGEGFYLGCHDPLVVGTVLVAKPDTEQQSLELSIIKRHRIKAGSQLTYRFAVGVHRGDWHWAARQYREFFYGQYPVNPYAPWLRAVDAWAVGGAVGFVPGVRDVRYRGIMGDFLKAAWLGTPYVQGWGSIGNGACPTYYLPRRELGGEQEFAETIRLWRDAGGSIGYYFHGNALAPYYVLSDRYFDTPWSEYPEALRPPSWEEYERNLNYGSEGWKLDRAAMQEKTRKIDLDRAGLGLLDMQIEESVTCYQNLTWHNGEFATFLTSWIGRYVEDYHCNTAYLDTFAFGNSRGDFNPYLGLHGESDGAMTKLTFLKEMTARMRAHDPSFVCLTEGVADVFGSRMYFLLSGFAKEGNLMRYMLPDQIFFEGQSNGLWDPAPAKRSTLHAFLLGNRFDIIHLHPDVVHILRLRQRVSPFLNHAVFNDDIGLSLGPAGIKAYTHVISPDGARFVPNSGSKAVAITLLNEHLEEGPITYALPAGFSLASGWLCELYRDPLPLHYEVSGSSVTFSAPREEAAAVILVDSVRGAEAWTAVTQPLDRETTAVDLFNFAATAAELHLDWRWPEAGATRTDSRTITLPPGELKRVELKDPAPADAPKLVSLRIRGGEAEKSTISTFGKPFATLPAPPGARQKPPPGGQPTAGAGSPPRPLGVAVLKLDFEAEATAVAEDPYQGQKCMVLKGNGGWLHSQFQIPAAAPEAEYRVTVAIRKGFQCSLGGADNYVAVCNYTRERKLEVYGTWGAEVPRDKRWHVVSGTFRTSKDVADCAVYVYNKETTDCLWFDEIRVERLR